MNPFRNTCLLAALIAATLCQANVAPAGEPTKAEEEEAARKLAELQEKLLAADLVVRAKVANTLAAGDTTVIVLGVRETFRGATPRKAIYVETTRETAAGLDDKEAIWLLDATDDPRRFTLEGPSSILDAERADEIKTALDKIEYASLDDLKFTVSLDKKTYKLDEPIRLTWTIENPTDKPIVIDMPTLKGDWGVTLGVSLNRLDGKEKRPIIDLQPYSRHRADTDAFGYTLNKGNRSAGGAESLLKLVSLYRSAEWVKDGPLLVPGTYDLKVVYDTSRLQTDAARRAHELGFSRGREDVDVRLGRLETPVIQFEVTSEQLLSLDEAKAIVARVADVPDFDKAVEEGIDGSSQFSWALADYASPPLLPVLEKLLESGDFFTSGVAEQAILMWARHPAIIKARPFEKLLRDPPEHADMSSLATAAADVAEAQKDATMIPLLLKFLKDKSIGKVSRQSIASSIGEIAGLQIDPDDLDEAVAVIDNWLEKHPEKVTPPEGE